MQNYETMVIVDAMITEDAVEREIAKIESVITSNGTMIKVDRWGKRKLAYEINKKTHGVYVVFYYEADAAKNVNDLMEQDFRINDNVLRWLTLSDQPLPGEESLAPAEEEAKEEPKKEEAEA